MGPIDFSRISNIAMQLIARNPKMANNPTAQSYLGVIQSGDAAQGQQLADNICKAYGMTREQMVAQAAQFFHLPM